MEFKISIRGVNLVGVMELPTKMSAFVVFVGSDNDDNFVYKNEVVSLLGSLGIGAVECTLLTNEEKNKLNAVEKVGLLTERFIALSKWCLEDERLRGLKQGYLGVGFGAAVALSTSAYWGTKVGAVVSYAGRPNVAMEELDLIESPVLLVLLNPSEKQLADNKQAYQRIGCVKKLEVLRDSSVVGDTIVNWLEKYLLV